MKAKDLIRALGAVDGESEVSFSLGDFNAQSYRDKCAKAELIHGECLRYLTVEKFEVKVEDYEDIWVDVILKQNNLTNLNKHAEEFDKTYKEIES